MKQVNTFISTYTADVSAVCSALYELGGMVVIHDPSGCNSTYNTHDEPRWYDKESLIYISGLSEIDAIMGNEDKLVSDIVTAAGYYQPKFIVILQSPVPLLMGTDFESICSEVEERTKIPAFFIPTTGMNSYIWGISKALKCIAEHFVRPINADILKEKQSRRSRGEKPVVNLLGATPLDFSVTGTMESLEKYIAECGWIKGSSFSMNSSFEQVEAAAQADVNLVLTAAGFETAVYMEKAYGIPYVVGFPVGSMKITVKKSVEDCLRTGQSRKLLSEDEGDPAFIIIQEPVMGQSLSQAIRMQTGIRPTVISPQQAEEALRGANLIIAESEEEIRIHLSGTIRVIADPMFLPIAPKGAHFIRLPQEACSGRLYRKEIPDWLKWQSFTY